MAKYVMSEPTRKFIWKMIEEAAEKHAREELGEDQYENNKDAGKAIIQDFKAGANSAIKLITSN